MSNCRDMAAGLGTVPRLLEVESKPAAPVQLVQPAQRDQSGRNGRLSVAK
jgi:hypothetical protein